MLDFKTKLVGKGREREKVEIIGPFRSYTARNKKFQKNSKKIQKIKKKNTIMAFDIASNQLGWII